jgi:hypothetical protein
MHPSYLFLLLERRFPYPSFLYWILDGACVVSLVGNVEKPRQDRKIGSTSEIIKKIV